MIAQEILPGVYSLRANHWDRRLFDELIPLPDGTSYNSYLVKGERYNALIDTVDPEMSQELEELLKRLNIDIHYIVSNHAEQDHSGTIPHLLEIYPEAKVVTNQKAKAFLQDLLHIPDEKFLVVKENDRLELGGKTLEFILTPWVHWPETMTTYLVEDKIAFTCDFFGSHRATTSLFACDEYKVLEDAKRYYAEIMMPFRMQIRNNMKKLRSKEIRYIAPSHGPVYDKPEIIMRAYEKWISDEVEEKVVIPYISMHGSTEKMVKYLTDRLSEHGLEVVPINLTVGDIGVLSMELVDASTLIFASPYVLAGLHPVVVSTMYLVNALRPKTKILGLVSSYGWGGTGKEDFKNLLKNLRGTFLEPVLIKGLPRKEDEKKLDELVEKIVNLNKSLLVEA